MLIVRKAQFEALGNQLNERFVRAMLAHLRRHFPERCTALGEPKVRELIAAGQVTAKPYEITTEQDVGGLIHFMMATVPDFGSQPDYGWAAAILKDAGRSGTEKIEALFAALPAHRANG